jgi:hypothetical protein
MGPDVVAASQRCGMVVSVCSKALAFGLSKGTHPWIGVSDCAQDGAAARSVTTATAIAKLDFITTP